jgi:hypothetical protein
LCGLSTLASRARAHLCACNKDDREQDAMKLPGRQFLHLAAGTVVLPDLSVGSRVSKPPQFV